MSLERLTTPTNQGSSQFEADATMVFATKFKIGNQCLANAVVQSAKFQKNQSTNKQFEEERKKRERDRHTNTSGMTMGWWRQNVIFMECLRTPCYVSASQRGITQKSLDWLQTSKPNAGVECCDLKAPNQTDVTTSPILLKKWAAMSIQSNTNPEKKQYENHQKTPNHTVFTKS